MPFFCLTNIFTQNNKDNPVFCTPSPLFLSKIWRCVYFLLLALTGGGGSSPAGHSHPTHLICSMNNEVGLRTGQA